MQSVAAAPLAIRRSRWPPCRGLICATRSARNTPRRPRQPPAASSPRLALWNLTPPATTSEGETVLDFGSGAGADVLISARRVGPTGRAIGIDMTDEMLELARRNAADAGVESVAFLKGYLEDLPLGEASVDVVISNCVINLSATSQGARRSRPGAQARRPVRGLRCHRRCGHGRGRPRPTLLHGPGASPAH